MNQNAWVDKKNLELAISESERWCPKETGGVLMGYWSDNDVVITNLIGPGPKAVHKRRSFTPDDQWQANEIAKIYNESKRVITYLGDWHSHPYGAPELSIKDLVTLFRVARHKPARAPKPVMGILHNNPLWRLDVSYFAFSKILSGAPVVSMNVVWYDNIV